MIGSLFVLYMYLNMLYQYFLYINIYIYVLYMFGWTSLEVRSSDALPPESATHSERWAEAAPAVQLSRRRGKWFATDCGLGVGWHTQHWNFLDYHVTSLSHPNPIGSMYGIYGNIYHQYTPNVSIYTSTMDPMGIPMFNHVHAAAVSHASTSGCWNILHATPAVKSKLLQQMHDASSKSLSSHKCAGFAGEMCTSPYPPVRSSILYN